MGYYQGLSCLFTTLRMENNWLQIGSDHTSGLIINLLENDSYFELGGWGDGQSPGGSYLRWFCKKNRN